MLLPGLVGAARAVVDKVTLPQPLGAVDVVRVVDGQWDADRQRDAVGDSDDCVDKDGDLEERPVAMVCVTDPVTVNDAYENDARCVPSIEFSGDALAIVAEPEGLGRAELLMGLPVGVSEPEMDALVYAELVRVESGPREAVTQGLGDGVLEGARVVVGVVEGQRDDEGVRLGERVAELDLEAAMVTTVLDTVAVLHTVVLPERLGVTLVDGLTDDTRLADGRCVPTIEKSGDDVGTPDGLVETVGRDAVARRVLLGVALKQTLGRGAAVELPHAVSAVVALLAKDEDAVSDGEEDKERLAETHEDCDAERVSLGNRDAEGVTVYE